MGDSHRNKWATLMKLSLICESRLILYKGVSEWGGADDWPATKVGSKGRHIPGFLSSLEIGFVYSEPDLTGSHYGMIVKFSVNRQNIEDRTEAYKQWCDENGNTTYDISMSFPEEWREDGSVWTVRCSGSAHDVSLSCYSGTSFVYAGVPLPYVVTHFFNNQEEWEASGGPR